MTIRTILADDEQPSRERLRLALAGYPGIEIVAEAANGVQALELIQSLRPQLVFLDIQMPLMTGIEVLRQLKSRPAVIFITAYDEYALKAFELHAVDYLLKPFSRERLHEAISNALGKLSHNKEAAADRRMDGLVQEFTRTEPFITRLSIKQGRFYRVLPVQQLDFFRAEKGLVFWMESQARYIVDDTLASLESKLDPAHFMRVHRNALVNLDAIDCIIAMGKGRLVAKFKNGAVVEIGRSRVEAFRRTMSLRRSS